MMAVPQTCIPVVPNDRITYKSVRNCQRNVRYQWHGGSTNLGSRRTQLFSFTLQPLDCWWTAQFTHWIWVCVVLRAGLAVVEKRKFSCSCPESNQYPSVVQPVF